LVQKYGVADRPVSGSFMEVIPTDISGVFIVKPDVFADSRGYFFESYTREKFLAAGINANFVQDNESKSQKGVLRGLHFQKPPFEQGKLVRVIKGAVLDVVVDIRKASPTYGKWISVVLSEKNKSMCWIPPGFAHGFATLEDNTIFFYKCTNLYSRESEGSVLWNDPGLNIDWQVTAPILSEKDSKSPFFKDLDSPF
jgi:dTDP-4-dehydrorhamnose 3,5-epimerase